MPYVPGATEGVVSVQVACPVASVIRAAGHVVSKPGGPSVGARSVHESPLTGAPSAAAATVTVNESPAETIRCERVMLRIKADWLLGIVGVLESPMGVGDSVGAACAGGEPLTTGPPPRAPDAGGFVSAWLAIPNNSPVAAKTLRMMLVAALESRVRDAGLDAIFLHRSAPLAWRLTHETMPAVSQGIVQRLRPRVALNSQGGLCRRARDAALCAPVGLGEVRALEIAKRYLGVIENKRREVEYAGIRWQQ